MDILVASQNEGKLKELRALAQGWPVRLIAPSERGLVFQVEETGESFDENALIKARALWRLAGGWVLADDSGLCVEGLGGAPGVHTARYGGEGASDQDNIRFLLARMKDLGPEDRQAAFCCSLAVILPGGEEYLYRGRTEGRIAEEESGTAGFGYDPVFIPDGGRRSLACLDAGEKNRISHRGRAFRKFLEEMF